MEQLNRIELRGRIGNVRTMDVNGKGVCHFSVATNSIYRGADNQAVEETTWLNCTVWAGKRFPDLNLIKVGGAVELSGRVRTSRYTGSDGVERTGFDVIVNEMKLLPEDEPLTSATYL